MPEEGIYLEITATQPQPLALIENRQFLLISEEQLFIPSLVPFE